MMVKTKLIPVAIGITREKLFVESALNKVTAEKITRTEPITKEMLNMNVLHSFKEFRFLFFNCALIKAVPEALKNEESKI